MHVYHQYTIRVQGGKWDALRAYLQEKGIGSEVYYPVPVHKQSFYMEELGYQELFPQAERAAARGSVSSRPPSFKHGGSPNDHRRCQWFFYKELNLFPAPIPYLPI